MNDDLPPSVNAAASAGSAASEALDSIEVALEDDSLPTPMAPPARPKSAVARTRTRDSEEEAPTGRLVRPRMTLRIPDDEVARPLSSPPPDPSPPSRPEIAPPRLEPPPPRRSKPASSLPPPPKLPSPIAPPPAPSVGKLEPSPKPSTAAPAAAPSAPASAPPPPPAAAKADASSPKSAPAPKSAPPRAPDSGIPPRIEISPQRIIAINPPSRPDPLAELMANLAEPTTDASLAAPDSSPLAPGDLTIEDEGIELDPITDLEGALSSREGFAPLPPPPSPPPSRVPTTEPVMVTGTTRSTQITVPDSDGGVDIPVVEDEEFNRPSVPEVLLPEDLVSVESEPSVEARPPAPPPVPPAPPPPSAPNASPSSPGAPILAVSPPPPPSSVPASQPNSQPPPAPSSRLRRVPAFSGLIDDGEPERPVIGPAPSELAPPPLSEASVPQRKRARPWWEELFNDDFIRTMAKVTDEQIAAEADFIEDSLGVAKGAMVLDLACGTGRHAIELTRRGYQVVGYDLSLAMLARAADEAQDRNQKLNFVQGDMREMTFEETFDGIYCWSTSFGYFDEDRNAQVIARVHRALRKGGQFLLDVVNRDFIGRQAPSLAWFEGDGCVCMDEMTIDWITSRMRIKRTMMMDDGRSNEIEYSIRVYSLHELGKMLHDHGFRVAEVSGRIATPGVFFGTDSPRTLILAEKRA